MRYTVYGTDNKGDGNVIVIGEYDFLDEIHIQPWMFCSNMEFTIEENKEVKKNESN